MLTLDKLNLRGKLVLLRVDLNSPIIKGKISLNPRIKAHAQTIKELKEKKAKIIILAHQGRKGGEDYFESLKQHAKLLNKFTRVVYTNNLTGKPEIQNLKEGGAILLKNVRSNEKEILKLKADYFILDAFSISHRNQPSITGFEGKMPTVCGPVMKKELDNLEKIQEPKKPFILVLAGAKPEENISLLKKTKADLILTAGLFGQLCILAKGKKLGAQEKYFKRRGLKVTSELKKLSKLVITPMDFAVNVNGKRLDLSIENFPNEYEIFDIGPKTKVEYIRFLKKAKTIFEKGPVGYYQDKKFSIGTKAILKTIEKSKAYTLLGGGDTLTAVEKLNINKNKISYISLGGGALIEYLAGKKLPGVELVKNV